MADLDRQVLDRAGDDREHREEHGVAVARDDLGRHRLDRQAELGGDVRLDPRIDVCEGADRARDGAGRDLAACFLQPPPAAGEGGVVPGELEAEGGRLGVDAVAAAEAGGVFVLLGAALQRRQQRIEVGEQQVARLGELQRQAGIEHVGRRHPLMDDAGVRPDMLGEVGEKGDDVVAGLALDRLDALDLEAAALPHRGGGLRRDHADRGLGVAGMGLDLEPQAEPVGRLPDPAHCGSAVAGDHGGLFAGGGLNGAVPAGRCQLFRTRNGGGQAMWLAWMKSVQRTCHPSHSEAEVATVGILSGLLGFLRTRKKFWLAPILLIILIFGGLTVLAKGNAVAPFIYTLF